MSPSVRRALLLLHQWTGLAAALFLMTISVSGSALVFENGIDRALNPSLSYVTPGGQPLPLETLVARVQSAYPKDQIVGMRIADTSDQAYELSLRSRQSAMIDPYTGTILGLRDRERSFARWMHLLHTRFVAGEIGERAVGCFTVAMLVLALSGLVLWWPRKIVTVGSTPSWKRTTFDLHNMLGFYSSIVILAITLGGVLIAFEGTTDPLVKRLNGTHGTPDAPAPQSTPVAGAKRLTPDEAVAIGEAVLPGAFASNVNVPVAPQAVFRILNLKRSAHTGDIFGAPTQALYFVVTLGIAIQAITGVLIWWNARKRTSH